MTIYLFRTESLSPTKVINFLILVTFQIKDFEGHYLKLVVLQGYTQFILMNIVHFSEKLYYWGSIILFSRKSHRGVQMEPKASNQNSSRNTEPEITNVFCDYCQTCPLWNSTNMSHLSYTCDVTRHDKDVMVSVNMTLSNLSSPWMYTIHMIDRWFVIGF